MKTTDNANTTENPWAEGMKGSHDTSWLGRLWKGIAGAFVAAVQVADSHGKAVQERKVRESSGYRPNCYNPQADPCNPMYDKDLYKSKL